MRIWKSKRNKLLSSIMGIVLVIQIMVLPLTAFNIRAETSVTAGISNVNPGFSYAPNTEDYVTGQNYFYLENDLIKALIGPIKGANNEKGPLTTGAIMDAVSKTSNRENIDWTQLVLCSEMSPIWDFPNTDKVDLPDINVEGNTIVAKGASNGNSKIKAEATYSIVEGTPLIRMDIKLSNEDSTDYSGYLQYHVGI